jgi:hypothetical protein
MDAKFVQPRRAVPGSIERHPSMPPSGRRAVPVELHCCDRAVIATMRRTRAMVGPIQADQWPFIQPDLHRSRSVYGLCSNVRWLDTSRSRGALGVKIKPLGKGGGFVRLANLPARKSGPMKQQQAGCKLWGCVDQTLNYYHCSEINTLLSRRRVLRQKLEKRVKQLVQRWLTRTRWHRHSFLKNLANTNKDKILAKNIKAAKEGDKEKTELDKKIKK